MRLLYHSRRVTIVSGLPLYAAEWRQAGSLPAFGVRRAPQGGVHLLLFGACLGVRIRWRLGRSGNDAETA
jgi:hypothetical protein